jgi:hypothetical protein
MAIRQINIGNIANDGTGDNIRTAFDKINENFTFLEQNLGLDNTALNIGNNGVGLFKQKIEGVLQFKKIEAGSGITLDGTGDTVVVTAVSAGDLTISDGTNTDTVQVGVDTFTIAGGTNISATVSNNTITIDSTATELGLSQDPTPTLAGNLDLNNNDINGTGNIDITGDITATNIFAALTGNVTGLVHNIDVRELESALTSFDFGAINGQFTSVIPYLLSTIDIDQGLLGQADVTGPDFGTFGTYAGP